jgi:hypothetical protein
MLKNRIQYQIYLHLSIELNIKCRCRVKTSVLIAEQWILAVLFKQTFFSLAELNQVIFVLLNKLNHRPFKKLPGCRYSHFIEPDKPALKPLPQTCYEYAQWRPATVNIDYHVALHIHDRHYHYYSVPYTLVRQPVKVRFTRDTVEIYFNGHRVAAHQQSDEPSKYTTLPEHMPESHKRHLQWTPRRIIGWAGKTAPAYATIVQTIMDHRPHPEQGFRSCLGIIRLGERYGKQRLEAACQQALAFNIASYRSIKSILETNQDKRPAANHEPTCLPPKSATHVRGRDLQVNKT